MRRMTATVLTLILLCSLTVTVFADEIAEGAVDGTTIITLTGNGSGGGTGGSGGGAVTYNLIVPSNFSITENATDTLMGNCKVQTTAGTPSNGDTVRVSLQYNGNFTNTANSSDKIAYTIKKGTGSSMSALTKNSYTAAYDIPYGTTWYGWRSSVSSSDELHVCIDSSEWAKTTDGATYQTAVSWSSSYVQAQ